MTSVVFQEFLVVYILYYQVNILNYLFGCCFQTKATLFNK